MSDQRESEDELRQCASCRMKVSVWATKCHHCGEVLGRPRREETKLTLNDLGGSQRTTYAPSGNVTGALESFRAEEVAAEASRAQKKQPGFLARLFARPAPAAPPVKSAGESLPDLDEYSRNLASSILDDIPTPSVVGASTRPPANPVLHRLVVIGGTVIALLAVYFVGGFAWTHGRAWLEARNQPLEINYVNKAPEMLARGELAVDAYEEAVKAVRVKDTEENRQIVDEVRKLLFMEIDALMEANPWKVENHDMAYRYARRAVEADNHPAVAAKFAEVRSEVSAYKIVLKSVDATETKATFRLNHPDYEPEVTVEVADRLLDRFIVQRISSRQVELADDRVAGRKLTVAVNEGIKSRY